MDKYDTCKYKVDYVNIVYKWDWVWIVILGASLRKCRGKLLLANSDRNALTPDGPGIEQSPAFSTMMAPLYSLDSKLVEAGFLFKLLFMIFSPYTFALWYAVTVFRPRNLEQFWIKISNFSFSPSNC